MKKFRIILSSLVLVFSGVTLFLFQNFYSPGDMYEVPYTSGTGIPLSEIVSATPATPEYGNVIINADEIAYIDQNINVDQLTINGQLHCDQSLTPHNVTIKARVIYVNGIFQCGRADVTFNKNITISLKPGAVDPRTSSAYRGLVVNNSGRLILTGNRRKAKWLRLSKTALPGQNYIEVNESVQTLNNFWTVGDKIVIGPTSYKYTEAETFTITAISGNRITLSGPLLYRHVGVTETYSTTYNGTIVLEQRAEVANLTRNIKILPDESTGAILETNVAGAELGGHVMVMGDAYVDSVEFYKMGQAGIMARYPFHWHYAGNATGQFIKNSSVHHSFQRCITIHRTNQVSVTNNVCYNFKGHGFFIEDGVEVDNLLSNNLGILAKHPFKEKVLLASDHPTIEKDSQGRFNNVSVFWITNPRNTIIGNVAAGSVGTGFWMSFVNEIKDAQGNVIARPINENTTQFESNISHSSKVGFTWDGAAVGALTNNPNNPDDRKIDAVYYRPPVTPVFKKLTGYKNKLTGVYFRGYTSAYHQNIMADNGWNFWFSFNQVVKNSVVIGRTLNFTNQDQINFHELSREDRRMQMGFTIYDGPFELDGVDFIRYPQQPIYHTSGTKTYEVTPIPFGVTRGSDRMTNTVKRISFIPSPIYKAYMPPENDNVELRADVSMRDLDGTFTGIAGGLLVASRSLGILPTSSCAPGGNAFHGFKRCTPNYYEAELTFTDATPNINPWQWPVVARRSDGVVSHPISEWNSILNGLKGTNKFALGHTLGQDYEIMFKGRENPKLYITTEIPNPVIPAIKVTAQGTNCYLQDDKNNPYLKVSSLSALKAATVDAYYSNGNDFYFRLLKLVEYEFVTPNNGQGLVKRYKTERPRIKCEGLPTPEMRGKVESLVRVSENDPVKVSGWACYFSKSPAVTVSLGVKQKNSTSPVQIIKTGKANLYPNEAISFMCGIPGTTGYKYEFNLTRAEAEPHQGKEVHVLGLIPVTGGANVPLPNSGLFTIPLYSTSSGTGTNL